MAFTQDEPEGSSLEALISSMHNAPPSEFAYFLAESFFIPKLQYMRRYPVGVTVVSENHEIKRVYSSC
jgi:hypothetical protein